MSTQDFPPWFLFGKLSGEYTLEELLAFGKGRIDFLLEFSSTHTLRREEGSNKVLENPLGLTALMIAAAASNDAYFTSWLLEIEGDLFNVLFNNSGLSTKIAILKAIYGRLLIGADSVASVLGISTEKLISEAQTALSVQYTKRRRAVLPIDVLMKTLTAVRFINAYRLIKFNRGIVVKGWVIAPLTEFFHFSKSYYQQMLSKKIRDLSEKLIKNPNYEAYKAFAEELLNYWRSRRVALQSQSRRDTKASIRGKPWEKPELFPPCSRILYDQFRTTGYLPHNERLQLGLFLKALGMPLDEQLKFWYNAVDNVGLSWEKFLKKGGYYIRHIYGLEGSHKDYQSPKCETIIAKYFCPFARSNFSELKEKLKAINPRITSSELNNIQKYVMLREPRKACAQFLMSMVKASASRLRIIDIKHPIQFVKILYRYSRGGKRSGEKGNTENIREGSS